MNRTIVAATIIAALPLIAIEHAHAQDNPVLRAAIGKKIESVLSTRDSKDSGWHNKNTDRKTKYGKGDLPFGGSYKIELFTTTVTTESWIWIDNPEKTLDVKVTQFEIKGDRVHFGVEAKAKIGFELYGHWHRVVKDSEKGSARAEIEIAGSARIQGNSLSDAKVTKLDGKLKDLRLTNDALKVIQGAIKDTANHYIRDNEKDFKEDLQKAINGVKL